MHVRDFNEILHSHERGTDICPSNAMAEFQNFSNQSALVDLPLRGVISRGRVE